MAGDVKLEHVSKSFGDFKAANDVTFDIQAGSFVTLLGPSGAGKSTVLRMIGGFELPDHGRILIGGQEVTNLPPYRRDVNTVFQSYALFPHMTVAENVAFGLRQDHVQLEERRVRVRGALEMVQLLDHANRKPAQLSGGQQQRVALARALVKRPSVLLLDEPLAALDRKLRQQMQVELKLLQHELGITFIFVTHDQEEALAMSDVIAVMRDGRVDQLGAPSDLYDRPSTAFVAGFIGQQNFFAGDAQPGGRLVAEPGVVIEAGQLAPGLGVGVRALAAIRPEHLILSQREPDGAANKLQARIIAIVMLGDMLEYVLQMANGQEVLARLPRSAGERPAEGAVVWVNWRREHATLFPFEQMATRTQAIRRHKGLE
jgi:spermidine/putrescine transport system ATP-binding protein